MASKKHGLARVGESRRTQKSDWVLMWESFVDITATIVTEFKDTLISLWEWTVTLWTTFMLSSSEREEVLKWLHVNLGQTPPDFTESWRDGILLCILVEKLKSGCCPRPDLLDSSFGLRNVTVAFEIIESHFGISPVVRSDEIVTCARDSDKGLFNLLSSLKKKTESNTISNPQRIPRITESNHLENHPPEVQQCFSKGTGLVVGFVDHPARFVIFCYSMTDLDIVVEIKGPLDTNCCERITNRSPKRKRSILKNSARPRLTQSGRSLSHNEGWVVEPKEESKKTSKIPLDYEILTDQVSIRYIPLQIGQHKITVLWHGRHISESPYFVSVEDTFEILGDSSPIHLKPSIKRKDSEVSEGSNSEVKKNERKQSFGTGKKHSVRFKDSDDVKKDCGKVKKRRVLRYIVKLSGKEVVVDADSTDMLAPALLKLDYEIEDDHTLGARRNSWGFTGDVEHKKSLIRQFCVNLEDNDDPMVHRRSSSFHLDYSSDSKRSLCAEGGIVSKNKGLQTVTEGSDQGFYTGMRNSKNCKSELKNDNWYECDVSSADEGPLQEDSASLEEINEVKHVRTLIDKIFKVSPEIVEYKNSENLSNECGISVKNASKENAIPTKDIITKLNSQLTPNSCSKIEDSFSEDNNAEKHHQSRNSREEYRNFTAKALNDKKISWKDIEGINEYCFAQSLPSNICQGSVNLGIAGLNIPDCVDQLEQLESKKAENLNSSQCSKIATANPKSKESCSKANLQNETKSSAESYIKKSKNKNAKKRKLIFVCNRSKYPLKISTKTKKKNWTSKVPKSTETNQTLNLMTGHNDIIASVVHRKMDKTKDKRARKLSKNKMATKQNKYFSDDSNSTAASEFVYIRPPLICKSKIIPCPKIREYCYEASDSMSESTISFDDVNKGKLKEAKAKYHDLHCERLTKRNSKNYNIFNPTLRTGKHEKISKLCKMYEHKTKEDIITETLAKSHANSFECVPPRVKENYKLFHSNQILSDSGNIQNCATGDISNHSTSSNNNIKSSPTLHFPLSNHKARGNYCSRLRKVDSVKNIVEDLEHQISQLPCNQMDRGNGMYVTSSNFPPLAANNNRIKVRNRIRRWEETSSLPSNESKNKETMRSSESDQLLNFYSKKAFWEDFNLTNRASAEVQKAQEDKMDKTETNGDSKGIHDKGCHWKVDIEHHSTEDLPPPFNLKTSTESHPECSGTKILNFDNTKDNGISDIRLREKFHRLGFHHLAKGSSSDPGRQGTTQHNTVHCDTSRENSFSDGNIPDYTTTEQSHDDESGDEYIDDEIPDYAAMCLGDYISYTGLLDSPTSRKQRLNLENELLDVTNHDKEQCQPCPQECIVFGAGVHYGLVAMKNHFQVLTNGAGRGNLSVSILGSGHHDVTYLSVTYSTKGMYDVIYQVIEPGYYLISIRWADLAVPGSPFVCKVTY